MLRFTMSNTKLSAEEMRNYYLRLHQAAIAQDREEELGAVIDITANRVVNTFTDYAHRLGMKRVFDVLLGEWGSLRDRTVLDLGCGRGRWTREYAALGARVTGVDISPDAISLLAKSMPRHQFICQDIPELAFPSASFDVVNSVTVIQHLPPERQITALRLVAQWLKPGGRLVLLENVMGFDAPHVFPHRRAEWITMVEATGLRCRICWKTNFEVLFRLQGGITRRLRSNPRSRDTQIPTTPYSAQLSLQSRVKSAAKAVVACLSFPVEWICHRIPLATPTHYVMLFGK
jgi:SAM-dependent methyltransferase